MSPGKYIWLIVLTGLTFPAKSQKRVGDLTLVYNSVITNAQDSNRKITATTAYS